MKSITNILIALSVLLMLGLTSFAQEVPQAIAFDNFDMQGDHVHFFANVPDMTQWDKNWMIKSHQS